MAKIPSKRPDIVKIYDKELGGLGAKSANAAKKVGDKVSQEIADIRDRSKK